MADQDAFEKLYNEYQFKLLKYVWKKVRCLEDAEDLTQMAFLYCYQHFSEFDPAKASFGTWLFLVANSRIKNYYRDKKPTGPIDDLIETLVFEESFDAAIDLEIMRDSIRDALKTCSPTAREIVILKYFKNKDTKEIAAVMGLTEGNVRTQLSRTLKRMEQHISAAERN